MTTLSWMQPRDCRSAGRAVSVLCGMGAAVTLVFAPLRPEVARLGDRGLLAAAGFVALVAALSVLARFLTEANTLSWAVSPLVAITAIVAVALLLHDSSVTAQIFLLFPTLYGASQLRPPGAVLVTAASLVGELVVVLVALPPRQAIVDAGYVSAALITTSVLLTLSSERQARLVAKLEKLAAEDPLTGLLTRRVFDKAATSALSGAGTDSGTSLILLDIDNFKAINDQHGHPCGDEVLIQLADLLMSRTRPGDVVCRLGGDEVALLLPGCGCEAAMRRADEVLDDVRQHPFVLSAAGVARVSVSMGLAHAPSHATDLRGLYAAADAALYEAKQAGRDRVVSAGTRFVAGQHR